MKSVIQRVKSASVVVDDKIVGAIQNGILIFLAIMQGDTEENLEALVKKIVQFRIFRDENQKMNKSVMDVQGEILVVSQFTLAADGKKGNRPSFDKAADPENAKKFYEKFIEKLKSQNIKTEVGIFGAYMTVNIVNDGPVTFILEH